jgi:hypothetical protein
MVLAWVPTVLGQGQVGPDQTSGQPEGDPGILEPARAEESESLETSTPKSVPAPDAAGPPEAVIWLKDGQRVTGHLVRKTDQGVTLRLGTVEVEYPSARIAQFEVLPSVEERFRAQRMLVPDEDVDQRIALARWAYQRQRLDLAITELESILKADAGQPQAKELLSLARLQQRIDAKAKQRSKPAPTIPQAPALEKSVPEPVALLSPEQINLMKVYEVDLRNPPRMNVSRATVTKILRSYGDSPLIPLTQEGREALYRLSPAEILDLLFQLRARELYGEVQVLDQPASLKQFREQVHGSWLMNRCATPMCHGGSEAGRFRLAMRRPNAEETFFTNFLILERYRLEDGRVLIDYDDPDRSPLMHLGLQRDLSLAPHPAVPIRDGKGDRWKPVFDDVDDDSFVRASKWIRAMYRPRPEYPFDVPTVPKESAEAGGQSGAKSGAGREVAPPAAPASTGPR